MPRRHPDQDPLGRFKRAGDSPPPPPDLPPAPEPAVPATSPAPGPAPEDTTPADSAPAPADPAAPKPKRRSPEFKHFRVDEVLTDEQRKAYEQLLARPTTTVQQLLAFLRERGHHVCKSAVSRHRRNWNADIKRLREV